VDQQQQPSWRPTRSQVLWTGGIVGALSVSILIGYRYGITLWDWIKLLIVPAVIAGGGLWFNAQQRERERQIANDRAQDEALQAYLDQMSGMLAPPSKDLPPLYKVQPGEPLSSVARARTLTVLPRLGGDRKARVVQFLYEAGLIDKDHLVLRLHGANLSRVDLRRARLSKADLSLVDLGKADLADANLAEADLGVTDLRGANLRGAFLSKATLSEANLRGALLSGANLRGADLSTADLSEADLSEADLDEANLFGATLTEANLRGAFLSGADLAPADLSSADLSEAALSQANLYRATLTEANLFGADLNGADLSEADLGGANLRGALLIGAELRGAAGITAEELEQQARYLDLATMPNGQKYEDWIKERENRKQNGKDRGHQ
jgi:uncharacterized protein YjbI with pentapeptide repeats